MSVLQKPPRQSSSQIDMYAVQCYKCLKWRVISNQQDYEEIRENFIEDPFTCNKNPNLTCEDPADIEYDNTRTWCADKPNLPKPPRGFKRSLALRNDFSRCDAYYLLPTGKKVRSSNEVERFLEENPKYKSIVKLSDFNFTSPKIMEDTIPKGSR